MKKQRGYGCIHCKCVTRYFFFFYYVSAFTPGTCVSCGKPNDEYSEEVIALSLVAVGTCCHRMPHTVSSYLISNIIPAIAKYEDNPINYLHVHVALSL